MSMPIEAVVAEREEYERKIAELEQVVDDLYWLAGPCDEDMHPAWCSNHHQKRCDGEVVRARAIASGAVKA